MDALRQKHGSRPCDPGVDASALARRKRVQAVFRLLSLLQLFSLLALAPACTPDRVTRAGFDQAIRRDPADAEAYLSRGYFYFRHKGDHDAALADLTEALALNPQLAIAYYERGIVYDSLGDFDKAVADYSAAVALNHRDTASLIKRAVSYAELGEYEKSVADWEHLLELEPDYYYRPDVEKTIEEMRQTLEQP
jgi:tetratricopeptide (TPR) repeat protein